MAVGKKRSAAGDDEGSIKEVEDGRDGEHKAQPVVDVDTVDVVVVAVLRSE